MDLVFVAILGLVIFVYTSSRKYQQAHQTVDIPERKFGEVMLSENDDLVKSYGEKAIADYLYVNDIPYLYEPSKYGLKPDFYLPGAQLIIEYWGLAHSPTSEGTEYRKNMARKKKIYRKHGAKLLDVFTVDINTGKYRMKINRALKRV